MRAIRNLLTCALFAVSGAAASAGTFEFLAAPQITLNRVYRLDKVTGEVGACQYGLRKNNEKSIGETICYPAGQGAGPQGIGEFALVSSRHEQEAGVFRVNQRDGSISICYVLVDEDKKLETVVCTPAGK